MIPDKPRYRKLESTCPENGVYLELDYVQVYFRAGQAMAKLDKSRQKLVIDAEDYFWKIRHGWMVDSEVGLKGVSVSVCRQPGKTRELVVDFPFSLFGLDRSPREADLIAALTPAVRAATVAGWKPDSRGSTFRFTAR